MERKCQKSTVDASESNLMSYTGVHAKKIMVVLNMTFGFLVLQIDIVLSKP